jgi:hypothetical protein
MERRLRAVGKVFHGGDSDTVTRCADELYFAFRVTPASVWQAPRRVENFQAMIARHDVQEPGQRRALALALARLHGNAPDYWQPHVNDWGVLGTLSLMAVPPDVRRWYLAGDESVLMPGGYSLEPSPTGARS